MMHEGMRGIGGTVFWQAHRGGGGFERPDNTLLACRYGWGLGGIVELDVRKTFDGQIICLHDPTLNRTTNAPADIADVPVAKLSYEAFKDVDAGRYFGLEYSGEHIPLLSDVFSIMADDPSLYAYLDLKEIELSELATLIHSFGLDKRIWIAGPERQWLGGIKYLLPDVGTMQWLGGNGSEITAGFGASAAAGFLGLDQIQLHLNDAPDRSDGWRYTVGKDFIGEALSVCRDASVDLEVLPWRFEKSDIRSLLDLGVRWFATDEPSRFYVCVSEWLSSDFRVL